MKYMMLIAGDESRWADESEAAREGYRRVGEWWEEQAKAGRIVEGHELEPSSTATTVRIEASGNAVVTDGPFAEGKEMVGGYAILEVADLDEALSVASSWPGADTLEIRPIVQRG
jgi:hypothetical protein